MPLISSFYGISIYMYIDHRPPHFHVYYDGCSGKVSIESGDIEGDLPTRAMRLVKEWLELHKEELMQNWQRLNNGEQIIKIRPLI